jgi:hypothetical protein
MWTATWTQDARQNAGIFRLPPLVVLSTIRKEGIDNCWAMPPILTAGLKAWDDHRVMPSRFALMRKVERQSVDGVVVPGCWLSDPGELLQYEGANIVRISIDWAEAAT